MRVEWLGRATRKLTDEAAYIALDNPKAADALVDVIYASVDTLEKFPAMGRVGRIKDTREWAVPDWPYIIVYRVRDYRLQVLTIVHTRQRPRTKW